MSERTKKKIHQDWRAWVAVVLMLAAMAAYLMTNDDSVEPTFNPQGTAAPAQPLAP